MANLCRVRVVWSGAAVQGDGVSTFFFDEAHTGFLADLRVFFYAMRFACPSTIQWSFPNSGDLIDVASGELSGTWTEPPAAAVVAAGAGDHVAGVGARVTWATSGIRNHRRVRGSTFFCPLTVSMFDTDGTPDAALPAQLVTEGSVLLASSGSNMKIYSRKKGSLAGQANTVIGVGSPDKTSWLRSRRT